MEKVLKKPTWFSALAEVFGNNEIKEDSQITDPTLVESHMSVDKKGKITEQPIVTEGNKSSKSGGFSAGLKSDTLGKMKDVAEGKTTLKNQAQKTKSDIEKEF